MAISISPIPLLSISSNPDISSSTSLNHRFVSNLSNIRFHSVLSIYSRPLDRNHQRRPSIVSSQLCTPETPEILDTSLLILTENASEEELWAAACLRIRSFYDFQDTFGIQDHKRYLAEREFEALKERIAGKRIGFRRVSCINATVPLTNISKFSELSAECKYSANGEERVVVGTLDLNQCVRLPEELTGLKPEGIGADFSRAYLSNVCVAKELHRNGLGHMLVEKSKAIAEDWGISDLYVHVAVDNEAAKRLYLRSGFTYENEEPVWQAQFLDRPARLLLWTEIPHIINL
ncbi:uncharacterized protein LOC124915454 [Impatiens glandulifera]|uniref:uncharacterized protein LOC124915454 n=1 Tax=Impatiens glandulifera TaxID=253017 RepID=UPI001FB0E60A|nr:uncharacterized protein LOC124915454 [Impatiens glandulifera]